MKKEEHLESVQETAITEIKSASTEIIKENSNTNSASVYLVKQVAKSDVAGDERTKNLIIYGEKDGRDSETHE